MDTFNTVKKTTQNLIKDLQNDIILFKKKQSTIKPDETINIPNDKKHVAEYLGYDGYNARDFIDKSICYTNKSILVEKRKLEKLLSAKKFITNFQLFPNLKQHAEVGARENTRLPYDSIFLELERVGEKKVGYILFNTTYGEYHDNLLEEDNHFISNIRFEPDVDKPNTDAKVMALDVCTDDEITLFKDVPVYSVYIFEITKEVTQITLMGCIVLNEKAEPEMCVSIHHAKAIVERSFSPEELEVQMRNATFFLMGAKYIIDNINASKEVIYKDITNKKGKCYDADRLLTDRYYELTIKDQAVRTQAEIESQRTEIEQRLHERWGHYRRYKSGKTIWINSYLAGNPDLGVVEKDYKLN